MKRILFPSRKYQRGAAVVEFALVAIVFFMLLIGIVEMGRVLFTWNAMVEATRYGARVAAVCSPGNAAILGRMQKIMPGLTADQVSVCYADNFEGAVDSEGNCISSCSLSTCKQVSVSVKNIPVTTLIPVSAATIMVPPFTTTLPRESMLNSIDGHPNPVCT
jgi:Flp pilus assembly protein TadG